VGGTLTTEAHKITGQTPTSNLSLSTTLPFHADHKAKTIPTMVLPYSSHHSREARQQLGLASKYHFRGWKHYQNGKYESSFSDWRKAVKLRQGIVGPHDSCTMESYDLLGCSLERLGATASQRKRYLKNLCRSIRHEVQGDALVMGSNGGKWGLALQEFKKSMHLEEAILGPDHPVVAALYRKMASTLNKMGQLDQSRLLYCDALAM
jgi:tetratricopeptide (TPR) repeat protein